MSLSRSTIAGLLALVLAVIALVNGIAQSTDVLRSEMTAERGLPITLYQPSASTGLPQPAVVVAHGFSGNRQLMTTFGYLLAKNGYHAALIDFSGHGANSRRMPEGFGDAQYAALAADLQAALLHVRSLPGIDPARVAILGHSMGAGAVTRYGVEHPDVPVTIALSLGNYGNQMPARADQPKNLLIVTGAAEFSGFIDGSTAALRAAYPDAVAGQSYGTPPAGTARRLVFAPGVEHITVLFSTDTQREVIRWLDATFRPGQQRADLRTDTRMLWVLLFYVAAALGFYALASALFRGPAPVPASTPHHAGFAALLAFAAAVITPLALLIVPYRWMPLTVGNYVGMYFLISGGITASAVLRRSRSAAPASTPQMAGKALLLALYALVTFNVPAHLTWNNAMLTGDRVWVAVTLFACCFVFFLFSEALAAGTRRPGLIDLLQKTLTIASLILAVFRLGAPGFLLLLVPVLVILFVWHGIYTHWLRKLTSHAWIPALVNAAAFAWMIAATFALVA